jgi:Ni/Co efflux regulator RcnB
VPDWQQGRHADGRRYDRAPQYGGQRYGYNAPRHVYNAPPPYYRGGYLPYEYRSQRYWVNDWRARHLAPPPYGYQWVQTDTGDLLLVALATGLIANLILSQ